MIAYRTLSAVKAARRQARSTTRGCDDGFQLLLLLCLYNVIRKYFLTSRQIIIYWVAEMTWNKFVSYDVAR